MVEILYPDGYGTARVTMAEMQRRHAYRMEPEFGRRLFAWLASKGGKIGIGGGWRPTPSSVSQASRLGQSFHQTQTFADGFKGYCGVDLVVYVGGGKVHRAPLRSEVPWQGTAEAQRRGVHANVIEETWHLQPVELDGWAHWNNNGHPRPKAGYPITGAVPIVPPPAIPGFPPFDPVHGAFSLYPIAKNKAVLKKGMLPQPQDGIRYFQAVMRIRCHYVMAIDGYYGNQSAAAARAVRSWNNLPAGDTVDAAVWKVIDTLALH